MPEDKKQSANDKTPTDLHGHLSRDLFCDHRDPREKNDDA
jgi:hypothetical protein